MGRGFQIMLFLLAIALQHQTVMAKTIVLSDFDNTIVETRQEFGGVFVTKFRIFRVERRQSALEPLVSGSEEIEISPQDFHRIEKHLARSAEDVGSINVIFTLQDGRKITPGHYYIRPTSSFSHFMSSQLSQVSEGKSPLLRDLRVALNRDSTRVWGPFFPFMQSMLSTAEGRASFGLLTARGHSVIEWAYFFKELKNRKLIAGVPSNPSLIHNVADPDYDGYAQNNDTVTRKVEVLREAILALAQVYSQEPHILVFADDNQENIEGAVELFQNFARRQFAPIKFMIFNAGYGHEVRSSRRPRFSVVQWDGSFRPVTNEEQKKVFGFASLECESILQNQESVQ